MAVDKYDPVIEKRKIADFIPSSEAAPPSSPPQKSPDR